MTIVVVTIILLYLVLIAWTWYNLGMLEKPKKVIYILVGVLINFVLTLILFQFSKSGVDYINSDIESSIKTLTLILYTALNGCIILPFLAKTVDKLKEDELTKEQLRTRLIIFLIMIVLICDFETGYMRSMQQGILRNVKAKLK